VRTNFVIHGVLSGNEIKELEEGVGNLVHVYGGKNAYKVLMRKPEGRRLLGKLRRRWERNIRLDLQVIAEKEQTGLI
jgi:hypothetical protein